MRDLEVEFPVGKGAVVHAVSGISFDVAEGETLGIVGESGCGKSTVAKSIIRLNDIKGGTVDYQGHDLAKLEGEELRRLRPDLQMIFQDPISSLNPRRKIRRVISEGLAVWGDERGSWSQSRIEELMLSVGIDPKFGDRRAHQFSGGAVPTYRHRSGVGARPQGLDLRRAGVGARCVGPGSGSKPVGGHEEALRTDSAVHQPRPFGGEERVRPDHCHVSGEGLRDR